LNPGRIALEFEALGLNEMARAIIEREIKKPNGMIITTGPTGSGKTTTLYTILKKLNQEGTQIITLEDPIEYKLPGIVQMQVTARMGFAQGLKAILRQDPDIIMVGEIRELETADTAVNAALTGHLVLSTVHTNNAAGAIPRFSALGVKPFLLAPSLNLIIGQRLVRRVCPKCSIPFELNASVLEKARAELLKLPVEYQKTINFDQLTFYQGHSCSNCNGLGYKGRIGIYELLPIDNAVAALIQEGKATESAISSYAASIGMITMAQDGLLKALNGLTTVEEVLRVTE
jgi:type II secretory ATPase GspE/PulE/Tfp pilus assembly ATPase PilB-like protein